MFNISNELAISQAKNLRVHKEKLKEIQNKSTSIDNVLNPLYYPAPKRNGFKVQRTWSRKYGRKRIDERTCLQNFKCK